MEDQEWQNSGEAVKPEYYDHPNEGYLAYDPNTMVINPNRDGQRPINKPIALTGPFWGTKQPGVQTCAEPGNGMRGCDKWYGCKLGQQFPGIGPVQVRAKKLNTVTAANCYDFFETTRNGKPTSAMHMGLEGWKLDMTDTTYPQLGRTWAIKAGLLDVESSREKIMATKPKVSWEEIPNLGPMWWKKMLEKGLPLPEISEKFPDFVASLKPKKEKR